MDRAELEALDRETLVARATEAGVKRARILTRPELVDELLRLDPDADEASLRRSRGFFGKARDLLSRVVERGLHLPDAIDRIRATGPLPPSVPRVDPVALPTVTLAEIYAAQGHKSRAIETLRRVLAREPEHAAAQALLARLEDAAYVPPPPPLPPEPDVEPPVVDDDEAQTTEVNALEKAETQLEVQALDTSSLEDDAVPISEAPSSGRLETIAPPFGIPAHYESPQIEAVPQGDFAPPNPPEASAARFARVVDRDEEMTIEIEVPTARFAECVAIPMGRGSWHVSWRVPRATHDALKELRSIVRAVVITPSWEGPHTDVRDVDVDARAGELVLRGLPERAVVRVAVGTLAGGVFTPIAHSPAFEQSPRGRPLDLVQWTYRGTHPVELDDPRSAVARAASAARRAATS